MSTQAQATSVRSEIVVDAPIERAFAVFTEQFDRIKPREHNMLGVDIAQTERINGDEDEGRGRNDGDGEDAPAGTLGGVAEAEPRDSGRSA